MRLQCWKVSHSIRQELRSEAKYLCWHGIVYEGGKKSSCGNGGGRNRSEALVGSKNDQQRTLTEQHPYCIQTNELRQLTCVLMGWVWLGGWGWTVC